VKPENKLAPLQENKHHSPKLQRVKSLAWQLCKSSGSAGNKILLSCSHASGGREFSLQQQEQKKNCLGMEHRCMYMLRSQFFEHHLNLASQATAGRVMLQSSLSFLGITFSHTLWRALEETELWEYFI
jgi:hypothetical protein